MWGSLTSHNPIGLHCLLTGIPLVFYYYLGCAVFTAVSEIMFVLDEVLTAMANISIS
jgi:hypothetical protein